MKKFLFSTLVSATTLTGIYASATPLPSTIVGPLTFSWTLTTAKLVNSPKYPGAGKSTVTGSGFGMTTNILQVYTSSDTTTPGFGNANFLELLSNSFGIAFPTGSKLLTDGGTNVFVVDHTGTNVIVDASSVLTVTPSNSVSSGVDTVTTAIKYSSTNSTRVQSQSGSQFIVINYDDSAKPTSDSTKTIFEFVGLSASSSKSTETTSNTNDVLKASGTFTVHGFGSGTLRGRDYLIQGTIMGTASGTEINPGIARIQCSRFGLRVFDLVEGVERTAQLKQ